MKNKLTAALLAFFLGGFGVHQFYLGKGSKGIMYLLFFWTFIPALIALIDFIILLTMSENDFNLKYNAVYQPSPATTNTIVVNNQTHDSRSTGSIAEELSKLHDLKSKGILTDEEFENHKRKILS
jgi:TM2 domain-containing membrane protein YozV